VLISAGVNLGKFMKRIAACGLRHEVIPLKGLAVRGQRLAARGSRRFRFASAPLTSHPANDL